MGFKRKSIAIGTPTAKRVVRKKGFVERIMSIPSRIAFEIALFPNNVPLPRPRTSAWLLGGLFHFVHLCIRVSQVTKVPDSELGWENLYRESEGRSWFDWTIPATTLLLIIAFGNALYTFTRIRLYRLHRRPEAVSSPNVSFVDAQLDFEPLKPPPLYKRMLSFIVFLFSYSFRWLLGMSLPTRAEVQGKTSRVQQLQMWVPGELEMTLFTVYSPVHVFLWMATGSENWMIMTLVMGLVGAQLNALVISYNLLVRDKEIIASEVMHEYNEGFVYPRMNPIKRDVAIMTHQSEVVNVWED